MAYRDDQYPQDVSSGSGAGDYHPASYQSGDWSREDQAAPIDAQAVAWSDEEDAYALQDIPEDRDDDFALLGQTTFGTSDHLQHGESTTPRYHLVTMDTQAFSLGKSSSTTGKI